MHGITAPGEHSTLFLKGLSAGTEVPATRSSACDTRPVSKFSALRFLDDDVANPDADGGLRDANELGYLLDR
jgi:hypothetical protein